MADALAGRPPDVTYSAPEGTGPDESPALWEALSALVLVAAPRRRRGLFLEKLRRRNPRGLVRRAADPTYGPHADPTTARPGMPPTPVPGWSTP